jgi:hypothetical protein
MIYCSTELGVNNTYRIEYAYYFSNSMNVPNSSIDALAIKFHDLHPILKITNFLVKVIQKLKFFSDLSLLIKTE